MKLGKAFSDSVAVEKKSRFTGASHTDPWWVGSGRALIFATIYCLAFFVLIWRLFDLTLVRGREFRAMAEGNRVKELVRHAPRGLLLDRTGKPLVVNFVQYRLLVPCQQTDQSPCVRYLTVEEGEKMIQTGLSAGNFLELDYRRQYLYGTSLTHLVGYTGELSEQELNHGYYATRNYRLGDRVGRAGAEAVFEERLRGRDGRQLLEVDASGQTLRTLGRDPETSGEDITLSVDIGLAQAVEKAFPPGAKGAVVVSKPATGEILTLFSSPGFDANKFSLGMSTEEYRQLMDNPDRPLFNRAIGGVYPPGSTFKIVTALSGLTEGVINATTMFEDVGVIRIGPFSFPNWYFNQYGKTEGMVDVVKAIARSNDIFFYKVGELLGITKLAAWGHKVGLGSPLGIELAGEAGGLVPDPAWKNSTFTSAADLEAHNNQWYLGDTYHVSIGQGYLLTTPLQVNAWTNIVASGGRLCRQTILKSQAGLPAGTASIFKFQKENCKDLGIKKEIVDLVTEGMRRACATGGTGWPLFNFSINKVTDSQIDNKHASLSGEKKEVVAVPVACKTGTAEFGDPHNRTHAWFTVFAPLPSEVLTKEGQSTNDQIITGEPEISITVVVEEAGEGSNVAAPIAKKILEEWFSR